jgi:hypothetical protein
MPAATQDQKPVQGKKRWLDDAAEEQHNTLLYAAQSSQKLHCRNFPWLTVTLTVNRITTCIGTMASPITVHHTTTGDSSPYQTPRE